MRVLILFFLLLSTARAIDPEVYDFNHALVKFDEPYMAFRKVYCSIPEGATGKVPCVMGDIFPYAEWKAAREAAKKLFKLKEKD